MNDPLIKIFAYLYVKDNINYKVKVLDILTVDIQEVKNHIFL